MIMIKIQGRGTMAPPAPVISIIVGKEDGLLLVIRYTAATV